MIGGSEGRRLVVGVAILAGLASWVVAGLRVTTDITHFLPRGEAGEQLELARQLASGELPRTMVLLATADPNAGPEAETQGARAVALSRAFEAALRAEPAVAAQLAFLDAGPPDGVEEALWTLYQPRRFAFVADDTEGVEAATRQEALAAAARDLKRRLATPMSSLLNRVAPGDPFLVLPKLFERLAGGGSAEGLAVIDGRFCTDDGRSAVLFLGTRASSSDSAAQRPFLAGVARAFERVRETFGDAVLEQSGAHRFAIRAEDAVRADIQRVSVGSMLLLTALFLMAFGSLRLVLLTLPVVATGFLAGTTACTVLFGEVHGLTLAFGAALIGVSIDYAVHFHCHHLLHPSVDGPRQTLRGILPGLGLGAATTVVGFVALLVSTFPGLRELAVFAAVGITCALAATWWSLPALVGRGGAAGRPARLGAGLRRRLEGLGRPALLAPALLVAAVIAAGITRFEWNDDITDLNRLDPELLAEDEGVRQRVVRYEQRRLVVCVGLDEEAALQINDRAQVVLEAALDDGLLAGFRGVGDLLPSARRQHEVEQAFKATPALWSRMEQALVAEGFVAAPFAPFRDALSEPLSEPLTREDLAGSAMAPLVRPFLTELEDGRVAVLSFVHGLEEAAALRRRLGGVGAHLIDIRGEITGAFAAYRQKMALLLGIGLIGIVLLVALRHRLGGRPGWLRATAAACAPALLGAAGTIAVLGLLGIPLNVLSLVALLMVVSMGVDYGVFFAEEHGGKGLDATHLAVVIAGISTVFGFGLLAWSDQPALRSIGATSGIGVVLCLILAPTLRQVMLGGGARPRS